MKSSTYNYLKKLKYDVLDIYIYSFFSIKMIMRSRNNINELSNGYCKLTKLAVGGDKFYINQAVEFEEQD
jgi:hypothetical protein